MKTLIKQGTIVTAQEEFLGDILVEDEKITAIGQGLSIEADQVVDATGLYVLPGGIDQHVHFSFTYKTARVRGFETSNAAIVGGTTTVIEFVNQEPGKGIAESIKHYEQQEVVGTAMADYSFHGIVFEATDAVFDEIPSLPEAGIPTLKLFMAYKGFPYHCDDEAIFRALKASKGTGVTIMVHAENADVIDVLQKECLSRGQTEPYYHAVTRPPYVEVEATQRAINLAILAEAPLYVVHVSAKEAMEAIRDANTKGYPIYGETCTHYLTLDTENLAKPNFEGAKYVCSPALRSEEHREALWQAVNKGWLNAVSSDHCGFDWKEQKHLGFGDFTSIPNGAPGLENRLGVLWTQGVEKGKITRSKLVDLFATTPARVNGIDHCKGHIGLGYDADLVLYNPNHRSVISWETSLQGVDFNTYEGMEQIGRPEKVFLRGQLVVDEGKYTGEKGQGKFIAGKPFGLSYQGV